MSSAPLQQLLEDGVVDEVLQLLKSGKEADVYLVRKGGEVLAAKVYKERNERNFKNKAGYLEGRAIRSSRDVRAMAKGSRYGRKKEEEAWKSAEVDALYKLVAAGVRVPKPEIFYEGVLVMGLVLDAQGFPAPRLADTRLEPQQAEAIYIDLLRQAGIMLTCDLIHGDLSAFNVLLAAEGPTIIDLPQVITAAGNAQAEMFFRRDIQNLHRYLSQFAPSLAGRPDGGADLWSHYRRRELFPGYLPDLSTLRDDSPVPTFKPRHANRAHDRRQGKGPEVVILGAPKLAPHGAPSRPLHQAPHHAPRHEASGPRPDRRQAAPGHGPHAAGPPLPPGQTSMASGRDRQPGHGHPGQPGRPHPGRHPRQSNGHPSPQPSHPHPPPQPHAPQTHGRSPHPAQPHTQGRPHPQGPPHSAGRPPQAQHHPGHTGHAPPRMAHPGRPHHLEGPPQPRAPASSHLGGPPASPGRPGEPGGGGRQGESPPHHRRRRRRRHPPV